MLDLALWRQFVSSLDWAPLFVTVSGAHLYGFPSPNSDVDLRGCHRLPLRDLVGLRRPDETRQISTSYRGTDVDLVSHDVGKYFQLLVRNNGYVLEQIFSPLVVVGHEFLGALRPIAARCITRHHYHHYRGFYGTQRKLVEKQTPKTAKGVLYCYRVLLTGIHLLRTGEVEANLVKLNELFQVPGISELVAAKTAEFAADPQLDWELHAGQLGQLEAELESAFAESALPEGRDEAPAHDFLLQIRLGGAA
jgi:hypothetical protein